MAIATITLPKLGESITEATVLKWVKKTGDKIAIDDTLVEIATDKIDTEVTATVEGILKTIHFQENQVVPVGAVLATLEVDSTVMESSTLSQVNDTTAGTNIIVENSENPLQTILTQDSPPIPYIPIDIPSKQASVKFFSPLVLNIAQTENIPLAELEHIVGSGFEGRITKNDLLAHIETRKNKPTEQPITTTLYAVKQLSNFAPIPSAETEIIEMDRMRKMIAKHMVESQKISAHVTSFSEADVTNMVLWREKVKKQFDATHHTKITFTPMFIECILKALKKYPWINSSVEGEYIVLKKEYNIGVATALPNGNLIVPVVKNADMLNLVGLSKTVNQLTAAARVNQLKPDDTSNGTFTLTNVGTFGSLMGTPIINQPQVAILAVGAIKKKPVVLETPEGDAIGIRHMMYLSLSYDHRIIDGKMGVSFLNSVVQEIENWDLKKVF